MIGMTVRVGHNQIDSCRAMTLPPLRDHAIHGVADRQTPHIWIAAIRTAASIEQYGPLASEHQIQEVGFERETLAHAQDKCVLIELVCLDQRVCARRTIARAMDPFYLFEGHSHWTILRSLVYGVGSKRPRHFCPSRVAGIDDERRSKSLVPRQVLVAPGKVFIGPSGADFGRTLCCPS